VPLAIAIADWLASNVVPVWNVIPVTLYGRRELHFINATLGALSIMTVESIAVAFLWPAFAVVVSP
jgi:hypothetical protein